MPATAFLLLGLGVVNSRVRPGPWLVPLLGTAMLAGLRDRLRPDQWLVAGGISWCLIWVILGLNRWKGNPRRRLALIPAALLILTLWAHAAQLRGTYSPDQAVILHRTAVLGLAEKKSAELYRVPEAAYVKVTNRRGTCLSQGGARGGKRVGAHVREPSHASASRIRSRENGSSCNRRPVALKIALPIAATTGMIGGSPIALAPYGP